jgi:hypothetical protein
LKKQNKKSKLSSPKKIIINNTENDKNQLNYRQKFKKQNTTKSKLNSPKNNYKQY